MYILIEAIKAITIFYIGYYFGGMKMKKIIKKTITEHFKLDK
jgi:hypothetical protein